MEKKSEHKANKQNMQNIQKTTMCNTELDTLKLQPRNIPTLIKTATKRNNTLNNTQ